MPGCTNVASALVGHTIACCKSNACLLSMLLLPSALCCPYVPVAKVIDCPQGAGHAAGVSRTALGSPWQLFGGEVDHGRQKTQDPEQDAGGCAAAPGRVCDLRHTGDHTARAGVQGGVL